MNRHGKGEKRLTEIQHETVEQDSETHKETVDRLSMLEDRCTQLETVVTSVRTTANLALGLSVAVAIINFIITFGSVFISCGCENERYKIWTVVSCVLAGLVMTASIVLAFIGFYNEKRNDVSNSVKINCISIIMMIASVIIGVISLVATMCV